jgi:pilus assembly protein CpaC
VKPVTDRSGVIFALVETEVSQIDESVRVLGVPGLTKRKTVTEVNLREGEVAVLAGLATRTRGRDTQQVPGIGAVPVVGGLFRATQRREAETELLVLIAPRVLRVPEAAGPPHDANASALRRASELAERVGVSAALDSPLRVLE